MPLPVSHMTHLHRNVAPSPTTAMRFDSPSHCRSLMAPEKTWTSTFKMWSGLSQLQTCEDRRVAPAAGPRRRRRRRAQPADSTARRGRAAAEKNETPRGGPCAQEPRRVAGCDPVTVRREGARAHRVLVAAIDEVVARLRFSSFAANAAPLAIRAAAATAPRPLRWRRRGPRLGAGRAIRTNERNASRRRRARLPSYGRRRTFQKRSTTSALSGARAAVKRGRAQWMGPAPACS